MLTALLIGVYVTVLLQLVVVCILIGGMNRMAVEMDDLEVSVAQTGTVVESAVVLIKGFKAKLDECGTDPTKLAALKASLDAHVNKLAEAVAEGTVAEDEPPVA